MSQNTLDLAGSIYALGLNKPNDYKLVYNLASNYNVASTIFASWNAKATVATGGVVFTGNDKYEFATEDVNWVNEAITGATQSGANLILTYSGTNDFFRTKQTVIDDNIIQARVISHGAGTVVISPVSVPLVAGTHFATGMYVKEFGFSAAFRASKGTSSLYTVPSKDYDLVQNFRGTCFMAATDFQDTYPMYNGESWGHRQVDKAVMQMAVEKERTMLLGDRAITQDFDGTNYYTGSLAWNCKNRGGQYVTLTSALTQTMFSNILQTQRVKKATRGGMNKMILCGDGFRTYFQNNFTQPFIQYAGTRNTFGGDAIKGLDVNMYSIAGEVYDLVHLPYLDDPDYWVNDQTTIPGYFGTKMSNSFFVMDPNNLGTVGGGADRAPVQYIYWGQKGINSQVIPGMVGMDGKFNQANKVGGFNQTVSDVDGAQVEFQEKVGCHIPSGKGISFVRVIA